MERYEKINGLKCWVEAKDYITSEGTVSSLYRLETPKGCIYSVLYDYNCGVLLTSVDSRGREKNRGYYRQVHLQQIPVIVDSWPFPAVARKFFKCYIR